MPWIKNGVSTDILRSSFRYNSGKTTTSIAAISSDRFKNAIVSLDRLVITVFIWLHIPAIITVCPSFSSAVKSPIRCVNLSLIGSKYRSNGCSLMYTPSSIFSDLSSSSLLNSGKSGILSLSDGFSVSSSPNKLSCPSLSRFILAAFRDLTRSKAANFPALVPGQPSVAPTWIKLSATFLFTFWLSTLATKSAMFLNSSFSLAASMAKIACSPTFLIADNPNLMAFPPKLVLFSSTEKFAFDSFKSGPKTTILNRRHSLIPSDTLMSRTGPELARDSAVRNAVIYSTGYLTFMYAVW